MSKGDYRLWHNVEGPVDRRNFVNGDAMENVIFPSNGDGPADVEPIGEYEGREFTYFWHFEKGGLPYENELYRLKRQGYDYATTDKFKVSDNFTMTSGDKIYWMGHVLLACPAELWLERENARIKKDTIGDGLDAQAAQLSGAMPGVEVFRNDPGSRPKTVVKPKR